jgi:hypothetical protein
LFVSEVTAASETEVSKTCIEETESVPAAVSSTALIKTCAEETASDPMAVSLASR